MNEKNTLFILGGGIAGLTAGYFAKARGLPFLILEPSSRLGGVYHTYQREIQGQTFRFDIGFYRFQYKNEAITHLFQTLLKEDLLETKINKQVFFKQNFIDFPLISTDLLKCLGGSNLIQSGFRAMQKRLKNQDRAFQHFEDFSIDKYGKKISEAFLFPYVKKNWGLPPHRLSLDIGSESLNSLHFDPLAFEGLFTKKDKKNKFLPSFRYPRLGFEMLMNAFERELGKEKIIYEQEITAINISDNKIISIEIKGEVLIVEQIISTFPLPKLIQLIAARLPKEVKKASQELTYRNVFLFVLYLDVSQVTDNFVLYFPQKEYVFTRVFEPKNNGFAIAPKDRTVLIIEIPTRRKSNGSKIYQRELLNQVLAQLAQIGLLNINTLLGTDAIELPSVYPILHNDYQTAYETVMNYLKKIDNLHLVGQSEHFNYAYLDELMLSSQQKINDIGAI